MVEIKDYEDSEFSTYEGPQSIAGCQRVVFHVLKSGFEALAESPDSVDRTFHLFRKEEREKVKTILGKIPINIIHGYPTMGADLPIISITTAGERSDERFLSDSMALESLDSFQEFDPAGFGGLEVTGTRVRTTLNLLIYADHPDVLQYYYALTWVLLHAARKLFLKMGIDPGDVSGADLVPDPTLLPEFVYGRRITVELSGNRTYSIDHSLLKTITIKATAGLKLS
jgi:hypothetical protein